MGTDVYFSRPEALRKLHEGPIGAYIDLFADRLLKDTASKAQGTTFESSVISAGGCCGKGWDSPI